MSKIKKVLAVLLTLAMVMGMGLTTFAAEVTDPAPKATITVNNATDATIQYVQIVEPDPGSPIGWKFVDAAYAAAFKTAYNVQNEDAALQALIADAEGEGSNANAEAGITHSSANLGKALTALSAKATKPATNNVIPANSAGLYLITALKDNFSYIPMLAYVKDNGLGNLVSATVTAKGSSIIIEKDVVAGGESVSKGDKVGYTVNVQYPYFSADATDKSFSVVDTLTNATFEDGYGLVIKVGEGADATALTTDSYTAVVSEDKSTLTITFLSDEYDSTLANQKIEITYTATVGDVKEAGLLENKVESTIGVKKSQAIVKSDTVKFEVTKVEEIEGSDNILLEGAEFTLYEVKPEYDANTPNAVKLTDDDKKTYYGIEVATCTTDKNGKGSIDGLDAQKTYYVKETVAPAGYSLNDTAFKLEGAAAQEPSTVQSTENGVVTTTTTYTFADFTSQTIKDTKLSSLPSTGGIGTTIFTIGGCLIMIIAAALFFASRRKNNK